MVPDKPTVDEMMKAYAEDAVEHAKTSLGIALDYSPESIRQVEVVMEKLHAGMPRGFFARLLNKGPSQEDVHQICKMYGGYVGEVFRRIGGGQWVFDQEIMPGQQTICLRKEDQTLFPPGKIFKRLMNGPEDNVWVYSQVLLKDWK